MRILVTAATRPELNAVSGRWREDSEKRHTIDLLITGLGSVATAYGLTKTLSRNGYDLILNIGIAGSFSDEYPIGTVVAVAQDCFADLGVYEENVFKTAFDMKLLSPNTKPFTGGWLSCPYLEKYTAFSNLPNVKATTVNTVTGSKERAKELKALFSPDIEGMEGAAFFYVCLCENIPFLQLRSISNMAGVRDKAKWDIALALENLGKTLEGLPNL
ncbi:MAG: futalosine hydrolase [Prevotellaceae bacterium]|jgi:futalosine hydrolase|nr:futalosine hydrolase [Prevotellaceae bacterium]